MSKREQPSAPRRPRLLLVLLSLTAVAVAVLGLLKFSSGSSTPSQITYQGRMYMGATEVTEIAARANFGRLYRRPGMIDRKQVFVSAGRVPALVALRLADGHFNAYQLMP